MTSINVGTARAIVSRPTPPDDKRLLWHKQTMPSINPSIGELYYYDFNPDVVDWVRLRQDGNIQVVETFTATAGQTEFDLLNDTVLDNISEVTVTPGAALVFGEHYTITHALPLPATVVLDIPFALSAGDLVTIKYQY